MLYLCPFINYPVKDKPRHPMFISAEVEVNAFDWSVRVLLFRVCRDGHMASDRVLYIHPEPFIYVYVHACFWHRTENFEHLPCGPSRVLEPQWSGQMDRILLLHSLQFTQTGRATKSQSNRALDREISSLKLRKKNTPLKRNLAASKLRR